MMNSLSWMLYLGTLSQGVSTALGILGGLLVALVAGTALVETIEERKMPLHGKRWRIFAVAMVAIAVACVLPSQHTVLLIAASELGENVANSKDGQEMIDLLKAKIKRELGE